MDVPMEQNGDAGDYVEDNKEADNNNDDTSSLSSFSSQNLEYPPLAL